MEDNHPVNGEENVMVERMQASNENENVEHSTDMVAIYEGVSSARDCILEETKDEYVPTVGKEFDTKEAGYEFYNLYARIVGFGITKRSVRISKRDGEPCTSDLRCSKQGTKRPKENAKRPRSNVKSECKARIKLNRMKNGKWQITKVVLEHNHDVLPWYSHLVNSQKVMPTHQAEEKAKSHAAGFESLVIHGNHAIQENGYESQEYIEQKLRNDLNKPKREMHVIGEAQWMVEYFMCKQKEDLGFFYRIKLDKQGRLRRVFWVESRCRYDYTYFGDVVLFDSTYLTDKYAVPFAPLPFMGVNHHGQTSLFGCGMLSDRKLSSYIWLFKQWLNAIYGKAPEVIITDQELAIEAAIKNVFPNVTHRFCLWHISQKLASKLHHGVYNNADFKALWDKCIYKAITIEQFEDSWWKMVKQFNLETDPWIGELYKLRQKWIPVFLKNTFFAGMNTTQRSESINAFLDNYMHKQTSLSKFMQQYTQAMKSCYEAEENENFLTLNEVPTMKTRSPYERQMRDRFTQKMFSKFQVEVVRATACMIVNRDQDGLVKKYVVSETKEDKDGNEYTEDYQVWWDVSSREVECACRCFEFRGYLCGHSLFILQDCMETEIPSKYILGRWSKDLHGRHGGCSASSIEESGLIRWVNRYNHLYHKLDVAASEGSRSDETCAYLEQVLDDAVHKIREHHKSVPNMALGIVFSILETEATDIGVGDPKIVST